MEGAKPRKDEHVPLFECFAETEDPDILQKHHYNHKADGNYASIASQLKILLLISIKLRSAAGNNKGM